MTTHSISPGILAALVALVTPCVGVAQVRSPDAGVLLQAAVHQETVIGNLDSAITLYRRIVTDRRAERILVARALVSLGRAYEVRGHSEALRTYQRVVNEFGDQGEQVSAARARLAVLQAGATRASTAGGGFTYKMVFPDLGPMRPGDAPNYDMSPSGDQIAMRENSLDSIMGAALKVANSSGAVTRTLVEPTREMSIRQVRWSPDGKHILYREGHWQRTDSLANAIKIISPDGGAPRVVTRSHAITTGARGGLFWTPDSKAFTVLDMGSIITMDLQGKVLRTIPFKVDHLTQFTGYSPDGRWMAFHRTAEGTEQAQFDIFLMPAEGGQPVQITRSGHVDTWPAFAPDGRSLYFVSNRNGSPNIWQVEIDPRTGRPQRDPAQLTSYSDVSVRLLKVLPDGRVVYALVQGLGAIRVAATATPQSQRIIARGNDPWLSPDGRTVYYVAQGVTPRGIFAAATDGQSPPRRLTTSDPGALSFQSFSVTRDGESLAYFTQEGAESVLRVVPTAGGASREIVRRTSREHVVPAWSPDGSQIAYTQDSTLYTIAVAGGAPRPLATLHKWEGWTVRWSPDGTHLAAFAYPSPADTATNVLMVIPSAGGQPRRVTAPEESGYKEIAEWHPDSRRLTYMYYGHDNRGDETRWAHLDGRPTTRLLDQPYPTWDYIGTWHPNGREFYFIASTGAWNLYAHDTTTGLSRMIWNAGGTNPGAQGQPSFSGDGSMVAWETGTTTRQLWIMERQRP